MFPSDSRLICAVLLLLAPVGRASGEKIYESATLDKTGLGTGASVNSTNFLGVRFELTQPATARSIGGHFLFQNVNSGQIFGALVGLDDLSDVPDSFDLSTPDVLGHALIFLQGTLSQDYAGNFGSDLSLTPGFYALVFGSGLFGATGGGAVPREVPEMAGTNIGSPRFLRFKAADAAYTDVFDIDGARFFLDSEAFVIPEPAAVVLAALAWTGFGVYCIALRKRRGQASSAAQL